MLGLTMLIRHDVHFVFQIVLMLDPGLSDLAQSLPSQIKNGHKPGHIHSSFSIACTTLSQEHEYMERKQSLPSTVDYERKEIRKRNICRKEWCRSRLRVNWSY